MPVVKFTKEDLQGRKQLPAGWYPIKLQEVNEETSKDGQSTNWACRFVIDGHRDEQYNGVPIRHWFNEKAMGRLVAFIGCFASDLEEGKGYELNDALGRPVLAYCHFDVDRKFNVIDDFKRAS